MHKMESINNLWALACKQPRTNGVEVVTKSALPSAVQLYLGRAIAPSTASASAVRLRMRGTINLSGWHTFVADQIIWRHVGMIWQARAWVYGLSISGSDRLLGGLGAMQWKFFGLVPIMSASGPNITRSAAGRMNIEFLWLPSALASPEVTWSEMDAAHIRASFRANGKDAVVDYGIDESGKMTSVSMLRWGNPCGEPYGYYPFGGVIEESRTFGDFTIPSQLRVGWFFGTDRFEAEGEFFRATVERAAFA